MEPAYNLVVHDNYGISLPSQKWYQKSTKAPKVRDVAEMVSLALTLGVPVLSESGNANMERTNLAAGISSKVSVFKLKSKLVELNNRKLASGSKLVVSKHVRKGYVEEENQRYDALVRDLLFLSHSSISEHDNFVNIIAIGWEDDEDSIHSRIWPVLVLEFSEYGTLEDYFRLEDTDKSWDTKMLICTDVAAGLTWLHQCRIIHSDVKFGNVLIFSNSDPCASYPYRAKLSDFGFALDVDALEKSGQETALLEGFTPPCAPEAESDIPLSLLPKVDVFSYGLLVCRVFLNGDETFSEALQSPSYTSGDLADDVQEGCIKLGCIDDLQLQLVRKLTVSTTSAEPVARVDMEDVLDMMSYSIAERTKLQAAAVTVESKNYLTTVPEIETIWALGLSAKARRTIIDDLLRGMQDFEKVEQDDEDPEQQTVAAKVAYQLYLAYLIGFGCDKLMERAIYYLQLSARLGYEDAQGEIFATRAAFSGEVPSAGREELIRWLTDAALQGDKSCLQELRVLDSTTYEALVTSTARQKAMCERSGFVFADDFIETNDVGDVQGLISAILDSGGLIDEDIGGGMTWLHYAVFMNSLELASRLVDDFNFPINVQNSKGQTPLWISCLSGNYELSTFLLTRDADASIESELGSNPLHHLVTFEDKYIESIANILLSHGADINGQDASGLTPLHYAVLGSGNLEIEPTVAVLLNLGGNPLIADEDGDTPLDSAVYSMRFRYLESLLASERVKAIPDAELKKILANAFGNWIRQMKYHRLRSGSLNYTERIEQLVRFFYTDDLVSVYTANHPAGFTPLHDAYAWSSDDLAAQIIKLPNTRLDELDGGEYGYTPLMIAIRTSTLPVIGDLLHAGSNPLLRARTGENVLHHCVQYNPNLLPYLCDQIEKNHGDLTMMINQVSLQKGDTPLDYALYMGNSESARFLLSKGADPNLMRMSPENGGLSLNSLRCCLFPPRVRMLQLLLPHMDPDSVVCVSDGMNLVHLACIHIFDESKSGDGAIAAFINAVIDHFPSAMEAPFGHSSATPLHLAAAFGNVTAIKALLRRGASPFVTDIHGSTPIEDIDDEGELVDKDGCVVRGIMGERLRRRWRNSREILRQAMDLVQDRKGHEVSL